MRLVTPNQLSAEQCAKLADELHIYDVEQGGWEHEGRGLEFNANHVLKEIVRARRKDFFEPFVVENDLAPDAVQYALRFSRWAALPFPSILPSVEDDIAADSYSHRNDIHRTRISGWALAEISLADFTHRLDHASERQQALDNKRVDLAEVSRYLLYFAELSATEFDFSLQGSLTKRLNSLRKRFGIPVPPAST